MKRLLAFLLASVVCVAGDMVRTTDADFKKADPENLKSFENARPTFDLSKAEDRRALESFESSLYSEAMMEAGEPFFRGTKLKKGDDWKKLWADRQKDALDEVAGDKAAHDSLEKALLKLRDFADDRDATILERVVKAKFGGEDAWILLVHWERADSVAEQLAVGKEATLGHFLILAARASDQKILSRAMCG